MYVAQHRCMTSRHGSEILSYRSLLKLSLFDATFRHRKSMSDKNIHQKIFFASFNNDRGLSLDDKTKYYIDRNTIE